MAIKSPCLNCTRVKDPTVCENKLCGPWKSWWLEWWEGMRKRYGFASDKEDNK